MGDAQEHPTQSTNRLRCPKEKTPLRLADDALIERLNAAIADPNVEIRTRAGRVLNEPIDAVWLCENNEILYPVVDEIPVLLVDEAIATEQIP